MRIYYCRRTREPQAGTGPAYRPAGEELLRRAASRFAAETKGPAGEAAVRGAKLLRDRGRPYFEGIDWLYVSVTHTGDVWLCACSARPVGIDAEFRNRLEERAAQGARIAARFFTPAEQAYIQKTGREGFLFIWTRKEAYGKYLGIGLRQDIMAGVSVLGDLKFENSPCLKFMHPELYENLLVAVCSEEDFIQGMEELKE